MVLERMDIGKSEDQLQIKLHRNRYDFVLSKLPAGQRVLEIGTGLGFFSKELLPRCSSYVGVEFDPEACREACRQTGGADIRQADARRLPFEADQFSFIVCLEVLEHLGDYQAGVHNIHRCLRPDGMAILSVPYRRIGGKSRTNEYHLYEPGEEELTSLLRKLFSSVQVFYQYFEETWLMTFSRVLHIRKFTGTARIYGDLAAGLPHATARLKIAERSKGFREGLIIVVSGKKPSP